MSRSRPFLVFAALSVCLALSACAGASAAAGQVPANLDPLNNQYSAPMKATLASFGRAVAEYSANRFVSALAAMPSDTAGASTEISDYLALYRAKAMLESGRAKEAAELLRSLQGRYPGSPVLSQAASDRARALLALNDPKAALAELSGASVPDSAEMLCLQGRAMQEAGRTPDAVRLYLRVIADFVSSDSSAFAARSLGTLSPNYLTRADNRDLILRRCENLISAGRSQEARSLLLRLESAPVPGPYAEKQKLLLADAGTNLTRLTESLQYLRRVTSPAYAAQVNYLTGVCYRGLGNETALLEARDRALQSYPRSPFSEKLLYSVAAYYDVAGRVEAARTAYQALVNAFPGGDYAERSRLRSATLSYVQGRYEAALSEFRQALLAGPSRGTASACAYWIGRCYERLSRPLEAASIFKSVLMLANNSYYGLLSQEALSRIKSPDPGSALPAAGVEFAQLNGLVDTARREAGFALRPSAADLRRIERARQLVAAGLPDLALSEIEYGIAGSDGSPLLYAKARVLQSQSRLLDVILALRRIAPDYNHLPPGSLPDEIWDLFFPLRYINEIKKHSARYDLDPDLILGIIRQESAFSETARSAANARGLMQVLPSTGRMLARQAGITQFTTAKLYQPDTNIALGTKYLAQRLQRYGGRVELALAAYNAGDARVDRWLKEFGDADMAEFVERIPFSETRGYVKQVLSNRIHFHLRTERNPNQ